MKEPKAAGFSVSDATSAFFEHLSELKKWQEEQVQKLRSMQKTQWAQLQEEQTKMEMLLKCNGNAQSKPSVKNTQCAPSSQASNVQQPKQETVHETQISEPGGSKKAVADHQKSEEPLKKPIPKTVIPSKTSGGSNVSETVVKGLGTSFEEAIKKQMRKLEVEDKGNACSKSKEEHPKTVKRKFLKKGEGLQRFKPEKISYRNNNQRPAVKRTQPAIRKNISEGRKPIPAKANSKLEPYRQKLNKFSSSQKQNHYVKFSEPVITKEIHVPSSEQLYTVVREPKIAHKAKPKEISCSEDFIDRKMRESQELAEFEILEQHAEHDSFSSDSSFLQSVISGEPSENFIKKQASLYPEAQKQSVPKKSSINQPEQTHSQKNVCDSGPRAEYIAALLAEKKKLEKQLSNYRSVGVPLSLDIDSLIPKTVAQPPESEQDPCHYDHAEVEQCIESEASSSASSVIGDDVNAAVVAMCGPNPVLVDAAVGCDMPPCYSDDKSPNDSPSEFHPEVRNHQENSQDHQKDMCCPTKSKLILKLKELEEEISVYKDNNKHLSHLIRQKEEEIKALQNNRKDFEEFSAAEKAKIEREITAQRMQMKREKQTFERYRQLSRTMPFRKEREECTVLRQQVTKLQEELKKRTVRSNAECRRLKKLLEEAERERDILKFENQRLENQHVDLIAAVKACADMKCGCKSIAEKQRYPDHDGPPVFDKDPKVKKVLEELGDRSDSDAEKYEKPSKVSEESSGVLADDESNFPEQDSSVAKQRVRFNLEPTVQNYNPDDSSSDYMEVKHVDRIERLYKNGETEVFFQSGTKKYISADGLHIKFHFYNGDTKEIFPDKRVVYVFVDGTVETHFTSGMVQYEFPDGVLEKHYKDGRKFILLADGTQTTIFPDGLEETRNPDNTVTKYLPDGTEVVDYPSGEREIRSADYSQRTYVDGTIRTVYKSGRMETRYPNGRIQIKDKNGRVTVDTNHM